MLTTLSKLCLLALAGSSFGCAGLTVCTEIYSGTLVDDENRGRLLDATASLSSSLKQLEGNLQESAADSFGQEYEKQRSLHPLLFREDQESAKEDFTALLNEIVIHPVEPRISELESALVALEKLLADEGWNRERGNRAKRKLVLINREFNSVVDEIEAGFDLIRTRNTDDLTSDVVDFYKESSAVWGATRMIKDDKKLAKYLSELHCGETFSLTDVCLHREEVDQHIANLESLTGVQINSEGTKDNALAKLSTIVSPQGADSPIESLTDKILGDMRRYVLDDLVEKTEVMEELAMLSLSDPNVAQIVGAKDKYWEEYVAEVSASGWFGNSEISVRMENLGEYHLKGMTFDPSRVTQATMDTLKVAVQVTAAAYGLPAPVETKGGESEDCESTPELLAGRSSPAIKAEIASLDGRAKVRAARMKQLFQYCVGTDQEIASAAASASADKKAVSLRDDTVAEIKKLAERIGDGN